MNDNIGNGQQGTNQNGIRLGIVLLVIVVVIGSVMVLNKEKREKELTFDYANASVVWDNESTIMVKLNKSYIYNVKVIGQSKSNNIEVEKSLTTINGTENVTFYIDDMLNDYMTIWVEVENVTNGVKEKQKWM